MDLTTMMMVLTAMEIVAEILATIRGTGEFPLSTEGRLNTLNTEPGSVATGA